MWQKCNFLIFNPSTIVVPFQVWHLIAKEKYFEKLISIQNIYKKEFPLNIFKLKYQHVLHHQCFAQTFFIITQVLIPEIWH